MTDIHPDYLPGTDAPAPAPMTTEQIAGIITPIDQVKTRKKSWKQALLASGVATTLGEKKPVKPYDWKMAQTVSLARLYENARCLKNSVYRRWMDNLQQFISDPNPLIRDEAMRRIEYISENLVRGEDDISDDAPAPVTVATVRAAFKIPRGRFGRGGISSNHYQPG